MRPITVPEAILAASSVICLSLSVAGIFPTVNFTAVALIMMLVWAILVTGRIITALSALTNLLTTYIPILGELERKLNGN